MNKDDYFSYMEKTFNEMFPDSDETFRDLLKKKYLKSLEKGPTVLKNRRTDTWLK